MRWKKQGLIYAPTGELWWAQSYAHLPTADVINEQTIRIYFASLDRNRYGRIGYIDVDAHNPSRIIGMSKEPMLDIGEVGTYDDSGVNPSCIINLNGKKYLYYIGWQRCERVPYMLFIGLAISDDGEKFTKISKTPILERTHREPYLRSANSVIQDGDIFRSWYVSAIGWIEWDQKLYPNYVIRYADSRDGIHWNSYDHICINFERADEFGFGRPWVVKENGIYKMWYSVRSKTQPYRIGYAESQNGIVWKRKDSEVGIQASEHGWDSEMICYACVVDSNHQKYMFYNGNRHGESGFGFATLEAW